MPDDAPTMIACFQGKGFKSRYLVVKSVSETQQERSKNGPVSANGTR
jgi:hypothetical protein